MSKAFEGYIGIDYSGAETCESSLKGLRVYMATDSSEAREVAPPFQLTLALDSQGDCLLACRTPGRAARDVGGH
jgi:hypothetical protein